MLLNFLKCKFKVIFSFSVYLGVFVMLAYLYEMPKGVWEYAIILCLFFGIVFLSYDFYNFKRRYQELRDLEKSIEFSIDNLPVPKSEIEREYQKLIRTLFEKKAEIISKTDSDISNMMDYYTLWVHQIKNPIAAMKLILQSEKGQASDQLQIELFKVEQYVEMVLQYLRLGSDNSDFLIKQLNLDSIIKQAVKKYSILFIKKKISLEYEPVNMVVMSDEKWLVFVVSQILSNALKYTEPRGEISIRREDHQQNILIIEDSGIGISAEDLPRICQKGYTGYNGRTDKKSTGIGLYLCKKILHKLGHSLEIESQMGVGTTVKINLTYKNVRVE